MQVTIIGTGNVATVLGKVFFANKHQIIQVYGRNIDAARVLADETNANPTDSLSNLNDEADIYIIAVSDKSIETICHQINLKNKIVLHTAGSVSVNLLKNTSANYGVLYPIQSLRNNMNIETPIPFLIDGNNEITILTIENLAKTISRKVERGGDAERLKLHTAAVFSCNFVNYMYLQSANFCEANHINFSLLQELIEETATRLRRHHPKEVFTGPAVRKDLATIEKHLEQLKENPQAQQLYKLISEMIMQA
ncbi:MAG: Rossmann-like and DUF2520 domain-containing protein [Chitinophagaceae bacterium]